MAGLKPDERLGPIARVQVGNLQSVIVEWGYNMLEGLRRYSDDPEVEFFKQLLDGEVSEAVLLDMNAVALAVFDQLKALQDKESRRAPAAPAQHGATGASQEAQAAATTVTGYRATLEKAFVAKGAKRLEALVQSARAPHPVYRKKTMEVAWKEGGCTVQYDLLFSEDESFEAGPFLAMLRTQYLDTVIPTFVSSMRTVSASRSMHPRAARARAGSLAP